MADINEVLGKQISSVKELRSEIKRLQDSLVGLDSESQEFKSTTQKLAYAQEELTRVTSAGKKENVAAKDSIAGLEKAYKDLYKQYKLLSDEQRNSDFGKNMAKQLKDMSDKINENKLSVGNLTSNIGNYEKAITGAFQKMGISVDGLSKSFGGATSSSNIFGSSLTSLAGASEGSAAAIGAVSAALGVVIGLLAAAYAGVQQNEELQMRWNEAMAAFEPIINAVKNGLSKLGEVLVQIVEWAGKAYVKLDEIHSKFTDWLGITKDAVKTNEALQEQVKVTQNLAKAKNDLTLKERAYNVEAAKKTAEVARLREEASATENVAEKQRLLTEAKNLQAEIDQGSLEIKQEHLRILQEESELTPNSAKDNEALAQAEIDVANAEARAAQNARMFNRQLDSTKKSAGGAQDALKKLAEDAKNLYKNSSSSYDTEIEKLTKKYDAEKELLERFGYDTTLLTRQFEQNRTKIIIEERRKSQQLEVDAAFDTLEKLEIAYNQAEDAYEEAYKRAANIRTKQDLMDFGELFGLGKDISEDDVVNYLKSLRNAINAASTQFQEGIRNELISKTNILGDYLKVSLQEYKNDPELGNTIKEQVTEFIDSYKNGLEEIAKAKGEPVELNPLYRYLSSIDWSDEQLWGDLLYDFPETFDQITGQLDFVINDEIARLYMNDYNNFSGTTSQKAELLNWWMERMQEAADRTKALNELQEQRGIALRYDIVESYMALNDAIGSVIGNIQSLREAELKEAIDSGNITEQEAKKKIKTLKNLEKVQMVTGIASVVADTAAGLQGIWAGYSGELKINNETAAAAGPGAAAVKAALDAKSLASAILRTTTMAANGAANIAAIVSGSIAKLRSYNEMENDASGGAAGVAATPMLIDSQGYSYYQELQLEQNEAILNKPMYVTVTDIEDGLNHKVQVTDEVSF